MKIAAYVHLSNMIPPCTGVRRHAACIIGGLRKRNSVAVLAARRDLTELGRIPDTSSLAGFPAVPLPVPNTLLERAWFAAGWPPIETWARGYDWLYSPTETFVAARSTPLAVTVHDLMALETDLPWSGSPGHLKMQRRWAWKFRPIVRHAKVLLAVSEFTKQRLMRLLGVAADRIAVVGNGVEDMFFRPPADDTAHMLPLDPGEPYALATGGLTAKKGGSALLAVAEELQRRGSPLRIIVVGFCNEPGLLEASRSLPNIAYAGHVSDERYHALLGRASSLLFLSRYEGFGIPIVESMAMGVPVIASKFASIPEVVGDAGFLVDVDRPTEIADLAEQLMRQPSSAADVVARGRTRAAECRWEQCVARVERALLERS